MSIVYDVWRSSVSCRCLFFLMIRRPPRSTRTDTLFPYTTLFRSPSLSTGDKKASPAIQRRGARRPASCGRHMIGAEVSELIQGYAVCKPLETTEAEMMQTVFPHPPLSEMMHESVLTHTFLSCRGLYRSEGQRVGKECVSMGRYGLRISNWSS